MIKRFSIRLPNALHQAFLVAMPVFLLLGLLTAVYWWHLLDSNKDLRRSTLDNATYRAHQVNGAVSEAVSMLFFNVDKATQNLALFYTQNPIAQFGKQVEVIVQGFPKDALLQLAVIGPDGYLKFSNLGTDHKIYLGDREHFQVHVDKPDNGLFISKPLMGKVSKKWSIQFSRRIEDNGKFLGVLVVSVSPEYLYHTLERLTRGSQDVLLTLRDSGEVMARSHDLEKAIGIKAVEKRPYDGSKPGSEGTFIAKARVDQIERLYHWYHLTEYPVIVVLGLEMTHLMAPVEKSIQQGYVKGLITTVAVWFTALLAGYLSSRMQANIRKRVEFEHAAMHDTLTGLKNRKALVKHLEHQLQAASVTHERLAVLFIDLNGFKQINDTFGHAVGDTVLRTTAIRLKNCARTSDLVARLGGDEFVIVCNDLRKANDVQHLLDRIQDALAVPIDVDHHSLTVSASVGVAFYPEHGETADALLAAADEAMYQNKGVQKIALNTALEDDTGMRKMRPSAEVAPIK